MYNCKYCNKECKNLNSLKQHEIRCKHNPNKISISPNFNTKGKPGANQYTKAKRLGLEKPIISPETRYKIGSYWRGKKLPDEMKKHISEGMKKAVKIHPESYSSANVNGRVKQYTYNNIQLDGKWELLVAEYLDENNIKWERPKKGIPYYWNNDIHLYFPDFYLVDYDIYIEVKGFQRNRDLYKWDSIDNLIVIKKDEINAIKNKTYNILK